MKRLYLLGMLLATSPIYAQSELLTGTLTDSQQSVATDELASSTMLFQDPTADSEIDENLACDAEGYCDDAPTAVDQTNPDENLDYCDPITGVCEPSCESPVLNGEGAFAAASASNPAGCIADDEEWKNFTVTVTKRKLGKSRWEETIPVTQKEQVKIEEKKKAVEKELRKKFAQETIEVQGACPNGTAPAKMKFLGQKVNYNSKPIKEPLVWAAKPTGTDENGDQIWDLDFYYNEMTPGLNIRDLPHPLQSRGAFILHIEKKSRETVIEYKVLCKPEPNPVEDILVLVKKWYKVALALALPF